MEETFSIMIAGAAGDGVMQSGRLLGRALTRMGFHVFINNEYPSLIRGGHNTSHVRFGQREIWCHSDKIDFLIALNKESIDLHLNELSGKGGIIYDSTIIKDVKIDNQRVYPIPMTQIVKKLKTRPVVRNMIGIAVLFKLLNFDANILSDLIKDTFKEKQSIVDVNIKAIDIGYKMLNDQLYDLGKHVTGKKKILLAGNEAVALGAIKAGLKFFAAYPITPASPLLHYLAEKQVKKNIIVVQAESEIAAINMVLGASYAGVRAMTATSGTGFSLMVEGFGAAAMAECPIVVGLVMRPGPGSGMPTFTSQADLRFSLHASHGEFARVIIAPGDVEEAFYLTGEAFNIAEKYQVPVILIYDKFLGEGYKSVEGLDESKIKIDRGKIIEEGKEGETEVFLRYKISDDYVSPRIFPGTKGYIVNSNVTEHDETGWSKITPSVRELMAKKRIRKLDNLSNESIQRVKEYGDSEAEIGIISWGSTKGPIIEAMYELEKRDIKVRYLQVILLNPFPTKEVKSFIEKVSNTVLIEGNYTGQLLSLLKEHLGYTPNHMLLRDNGLQFTPMEIVKYVKEVVNNA